eukprot:7346180-Prymnesium_polylepis.1
MERSQYYRRRVGAGTRVAFVQLFKKRLCTQATQATQSHIQSEAARPRTQNRAPHTPTKSKNTHSPLGGCGGGAPVWGTFPFKCGWGSKKSAGGPDMMAANKRVHVCAVIGERACRR